MIKKTEKADIPVQSVWRLVRIERSMAVEEIERLCIESSLFTKKEEYLSIYRKRRDWSEKCSEVQTEEEEEEKECV